MDRSKEIEQARRFMDGLFHILNERATVDIVPDSGELYVNITGHLRLIGGQEPVLASLTHLLRRHLRVTLQADLPATVDVNGALAAHRQELAARAREAALQVSSSGRRHRLPPMSARDRRLVHMTLAEFGGVQTRSVGQGAARRVVIEPVK